MIRGPSRPETVYGSHDLRGRSSGRAILESRGCRAMVTIPGGGAMKRTPDVLLFLLLAPLAWRADTAAVPDQNGLPRYGGCQRHARTARQAAQGNGESRGPTSTSATTHSTQRRLRYDLLQGSTPGTNARTPLLRAVYQEKALAGTGPGPGKQPAAEPRQLGQRGRHWIQVAVRKCPWRVRVVVRRAAIDDGSIRVSTSADRGAPQGLPAEHAGCSRRVIPS